MSTLVPLAEVSALRLYERFPNADAYHDVEYLRAATIGRDAFVAYAEHGDARLAVPLVAHPLPDGSGLRDAETPYGYAAPLAVGEADAIMPLWRDIASTLAAAGIINAFLRLHPFLPAPVPQTWLFGPPHPTAYIPLDAGLAAAFAGSRCSTQRSQAARATKLGFSARVHAAPDMAELERFRPLYDLTLRRLGARDDYFFTADYYRLIAGLGECLALIEVVDQQNSVATAALFLRGGRFAHYHLSARAEGCHNAAGALLFPAAAAWAHAHACERLHLGGGTSPAAGDSLLAYKRRVGRGDAVFQSAGLICDADAHDQAIARWRAISGRDSAWFQAYRQPVARADLPVHA